jgi:hypothetical protein
VILYHGTTTDSLPSLLTAIAPNDHGVDLAKCRPSTDFGPGFYCTSSKHQAKNWANVRARKGKIAAVLQFQADRRELSGLRSLVFVSESSEFWQTVGYCRSLGRCMSGYDIVYAPLTLFPQTMVVANSDQVSFHTEAAISVLKSPQVVLQGDATLRHLP